MEVKDIVSGERYYVLCPHGLPTNCVRFEKVETIEHGWQDDFDLPDTLGVKVKVQLYADLNGDQTKDMHYASHYVFAEDNCEQIGIFESKEELLAFIQKQLDRFA